MTVAVETVFLPNAKKIGDMTVRRALPSRQRNAVGPFVFFDEMGPTEFSAGCGLDVRPHPHIGLATVTFLFEGEIIHRDNLGSVRAIRTGEVNWMVAGRGIVHSERSAPERRGQRRLHGVQTWLALPRKFEDAVPAFDHHPASAVPVITLGSARLTIVAGRAYGVASPVAVPSPTLYVVVELDRGGDFEIPAEHEERAVYVVQGGFTVEDQRLEAGMMAVLGRGVPVTINPSEPCRLVLIGGAALDGPRRLWWNLVASDEARIKRARSDWQGAIDSGFSDTRFTLPPGESEFILLPD